MTIGELETAAFWAAKGWMAPWLREVDDAYWREIIPIIGENFIGSKWREVIATEAGQQKFRDQLVVRISQATEVFIPWLEQALNLQDARVLEIGSGSGSCTVALARAGAKVTAVDIKGQSLAIARKRLSLLGYQAAMQEVELDWLQKEVDLAPFSGPYDLIVCYAVLEHLLVPERLNLLAMCRQIMQRDGAAFAIYETPNRLSPFDWHSSKLPFLDILPDDLAFEYASKRTSRSNHPARRRNRPANAIATLYRFGRGASWHEFDLAFGMENLEIVLDSYAPKAKNQRHYQSNAAFEAALAEILANLDPPVPRGFCRPSLEMVMRLRAPSRVAEIAPD